MPRPEPITIRHGYLEGEKFVLEAPTAKMSSQSDDLLTMAKAGNMAAHKAAIEGHYTNKDAPFYYGKIGVFGYIVSHADLYDTIRTTESTHKTGATVIHLESGATVLCDDCNKDYTDLPEKGGILFGSKAIGPCCSSKWIRNAAKYSEMSHIKKRCPTDKSFADWVREDVR